QTLNLKELNELGVFIAAVIDFRSPFTASHSNGVSASSVSLARLTGFSDRECEMMRLAGYLHDLGKLAVPNEILDKPYRLTPKEFEMIRSHTYYTYSILDTLENFDTINTWGAYHHERIDGKGYPFHYKGDVLSLGSRIMCVADVFTALAEERPYRKGMSKEELMSIMSRMSGTALDSEIVSLLVKNFDMVNLARIEGQEISREFYKKIVEKYVQNV
ncbi:MAG: HD-GYP domain-containing protein, partial [Nitrospiraceae bacterium]|nr:HD-GYP domain-containing protein [Nitrospiraceae bacterium]